jgi:hypothetical protein
MDTNSPYGRSSVNVAATPFHEMCRRESWLNVPRVGLNVTPIDCVAARAIVVNERNRGMATSTVNGNVVHPPSCHCEPLNSRLCPCLIRIEQGENG